MKRLFSLGATFAILLVGTAVVSTEADTVLYHYVGSPYTSTNAPSEPGFRLTDFVVATIGLDSSTWGTTTTLAGGTITSGPYTVSCDSCRITTDASGSITAWSIGGALPGLDIVSNGSTDGTGQDTIFGDRFFPAFDSASITYAAGPRAPGTGWAMAVPEPQTYLLLLVGLLLALSFRGRRFPTS